MRPRLGITLPSFVDDPEVPLRVARAAESAGLDGVFAFDHVWRGVGRERRPALECFTLLGAVAAETSTIHVGTLVARATLRPAATLAHSFETLQRVSGGRVIAGIGAGDAETREENEAYGIPFGSTQSRVDALRDSVAATRGQGFPVWVGGRAAQVATVCASADAWNRWGGTPEEFASQAAIVREVAPAASLTWGGLVLLGADEREARAKTERYAPGTHVIVGGPEQVAARLREFVEHGAEWLIIGPIDSSNPDNAQLVAELPV